MGAIRKRGKQYEIRYYDSLGRRRSEAIGPNLHEARQVLAQREWERRNGKFRLTRKAITMAEFIAKWEEDFLRFASSSAASSPSRWSATATT